MGRCCPHTDCVELLAVVVGPFLGPTGSNTSTSSVLTTLPGGPNTIVPAGSNITSGTETVPFPKMVLNDDCTLSVLGPNGTVLWHTNTTSLGPCTLVVSPNGTMSVVDLGKGNTTLWSNANDFINTTAMCGPFTVEMLSSGKLVEKDCKNQTVFEAPGQLPPGDLS